MSYPSLRIEGNIISPDILAQLENEEQTVGQRTNDFGLPAGTKVKDEIAHSWAESQEAYRRFKQRLERLNIKDAATSLTRHQYMVPFFSFLGYELQSHASGLSVTGQTQTYPISHTASNRGNTPIYIIGYNDPAGLDRKPENASRRMSAHALMQEYLNLAEALYGIVTNGRVIRLLRDSSRLVKQSYLEFDLERIFEDNLYADYALLYRLLHVTRLPADAQRPAECLLERYHQDALASGARIRDGLSKAVEQAIIDFANGFLSHPENNQLRTMVQSGDLNSMQYYQLLLRLIYRILFLMVIEERNLIFPSITAVEDKTQLLQHQRIYEQGYSIRRLRTLAEKHLEGSKRHTDLWQSLISTFQLFASNSNGHQLGIMPLAGDLFAPHAIGVLAQSTLSNNQLLRCILHLSRYTSNQGTAVRVNYGALNVEEFGSVYEGLLGYTPHIDTSAGQVTFTFRELQGNDRKTSGSYYTPDSLVQSVLDSALNPVIAQASKGKKPAEAAKAIRALRICEPAVGSGHFLLGAGRRLAHALATAEAEANGASEYAPSDYQAALRDVIEHCLYGVDINPMAAELCRVALWIEAHEPGKPLSFIDHHIQVGNSLLGTTPELIQAGIPDEAFSALQGDNKQTVTELKRRNKAERRPLGPMFAQQDDQQRNELSMMAAQLNALASDTLHQLTQKGNQYRDYLTSPAYQRQKLIADAWCAAFVAVKQPMSAAFGRTAHGITTAVIQRLIQGESIDASLQAEITQLAGQYQFFHWHLAFPDVMLAGGFDCVLGNPPWKKVALDEKEWFGNFSDPLARSISKTSNTSQRRGLIQSLKDNNPAFFAQFESAKSLTERQIHFFLKSLNYPLCGVGDVNLYSLFVEKMRILALESHGYVGCIVPTGIATDDTTKQFFASLIDNNNLVSLFDFENTLLIFPIAAAARFSLLTLSKKNIPNRQIKLMFNCQSIGDVNNDERAYELSADQIRLLNPNTHTCPVFRSRHDAELSLAVYRRTTILLEEKSTNGNAWDIKFQRMFDMSTDSHLFQKTSQNMLLFQDYLMMLDNIVYVPLYEAKLMHHYNHRYNTFAGILEQAKYGTKPPTHKSTDIQLSSPFYRSEPRYWIRQDIVQEQINNRDYYIGFRSLTNTTTNRRTFVSCIFPQYALGNSLGAIIIDDAIKLLLLNAMFSSFVFDYFVRQSIGGSNMNLFIVKQLPVLPPSKFDEIIDFLGTHITLKEWILPRALELTYTSWDLSPFANAVGYNGPPFRWDTERRQQIIDEIDACFFHIFMESTSDADWVTDRYDSEEQFRNLTNSFPTPRDAVTYILDTFRIIKERDEQQYGSYRTRDQIMHIYDAMQQAMRDGTTYQSPLTPAAGIPLHADGQMFHYADLSEPPRHIHIDEARLDYTVDVVAVDDVRFLRNLPTQFRCRLPDGQVVWATKIDVLQATEGQNIIVYDQTSSTIYTGKLQSTNSYAAQPDTDSATISLIFQRTTGSQIISVNSANAMAYSYTFDSM